MNDSLFLHTSYVISPSLWLLWRFLCFLYSTISLWHFQVGIWFYFMLFWFFLTPGKFSANTLFYYCYFPFSLFLPLRFPLDIHLTSVFYPLYLLTDFYYSSSLYFSVLLSRWFLQISHKFFLKLCLLIYYTSLLILYFILSSCFLVITNPIVIF